MSIRRTSDTLLHDIRCIAWLEFTCWCACHVRAAQCCRELAELTISGLARVICEIKNNYY